ncbi:MAG: hypothetical protein J7556_14960 [Acidovorax sp.]|nr:hypothetical protein [Acidovorax sp.]
MADQIHPLTLMPALVPQAAAHFGIPLASANRHEPGTPLWHLFNNAYRAAAHAVECEVA